MSEPILKVRKLSVAFGCGPDATQVVRDISFNVAKGEIVGIVGESGSGKSVSCRAILGLLPETATVSGTIEYQGRDLLCLSDDELREARGRDVSMVFQNPASHLDPLMSVGAQVSEPLIHHKGTAPDAARELAIERLREVQLDRPEQRVDNYPHQLSGGMKQRVMIASAVACDPGLLLADEPTTALDVTVQARILELLKSLNKNHELSIILVSHDLAVIAQVCDRVLVMRRGEIIEFGTTDNIINSPLHPYTQQLIESQPSRMTARAATAVESEALLEIEKLGVEFPLPGGRVLKALDDVSVVLKQGESLGIVGESGSGKSTLARAVMGLVKSNQGDIRLNGKSILNRRGEFALAICRKMQMVFQNPYDSLNPRYTVYQSIAEPLRRHKLVSPAGVKQRVTELMELVELDPELTVRRPSQLSGGQCQRVGIARALAMNPELLIADEITSALDVTIQAQIIDLLKRLRDKQGLSVVFISHDLALVRSFCDHVAVFQSGKIVEAGTVQQVLEQPQEFYTRELIHSAPAL